MKRNMIKTAEMVSQNTPDHYDINSSEIFDLMEKARKTPGDTYEAIITAFRYGFVLGHRATVAGKVKKHL